MTNKEIASLLRKIEIAYQILEENRFKIIAYQRAADAVESETRELSDLWKSGKLEELSGVGPTIRHHLEDLFKTGHVIHFETVLSSIPSSVFPLLTVPGIGPKKAIMLVKTLKLNNPDTVIADLKQATEEHKLEGIPGFGKQSESVIAVNTTMALSGTKKEHRILISEADVIASDLISYLQEDDSVTAIDVLGSLRRRSPTIGDIDLAAVTSKPERVIERFVRYPKEKLIERGSTGASILLKNGVHVDLRIADARSYGAMLQYFTGSKNHNVALRSLALSKGWSLSEYGIKATEKNSNRPKKFDKKWNETKKMYQFDSEKDFYGFLGLSYVPPELREDRGEVDAALLGDLPSQISLSDIRGDLHMHTSYDIESSHDIGSAPLSKMLDQAELLGYEYIGISDHNPSVSNHTEDQIIDIMKRREEYYRKSTQIWNEGKTKKIQVYVMLEVDINPDGQLALPEKAFRYVDAVVASVHSSFALEGDVMTKRLLSAMTANPKVRIIGHPTGRLLLKRESIKADWDRLFPVLKERNIALEINASPYRLDLPDQLAFEARKAGINFVIDSDAHAANDMDVMPYGISVARRGWVEKKDVVNTRRNKDMLQWLQPGDIGS